VQLRTRIALTFSVLLTVALATALVVVSLANQDIKERTVAHEVGNFRTAFEALLEANRRQLTAAAHSVTDDFAVKQQIALHDSATLVSTLENSACRIFRANLSPEAIPPAGCDESLTASRIDGVMSVLTAVNGRVMASYGSGLEPGQAFPNLEQILTSQQHESFMIEQGRLYQIVVVEVRSPLRVAWLIMGFELGTKTIAELRRNSLLDVTLSIATPRGWVRLHSTAPADSRAAEHFGVEPLNLSGIAEMQLAPTRALLEEATKPFDELRNELMWLALLSLLATAGAAFWLARNITRPLEKLIQAVDQIRAGRYDTAVTVERNDELGTLAEGLQLMQAEVQHRDQRIRRLAYHDGVTGLMNRTAFVEAVSAALAGPHRPIAVAVFNLQRFRRINEHLGYDVGDDVLRRVAERLVGSGGGATQQGAAVARLGADEFAAMLPLDAAADAQRWGTMLLSRLSDPVVVDAQPIDVSATVGVAVASSEADQADELLVCADLALQSARSEKRGLAVYRPSLKAATREQLSLLGELHQAVERDELQLYFQPKVELATGRVAGAEVLMRWQHPSRGLLGPSAFIPFAEQTGFIRRITQWAVDRAVRQAAAWRVAGVSLPIAVNVSADDLADVQLDLRVATALKLHGLPAQLLTLEITESGFIDNPARALQMLDSLAALGVVLSIDDFGTGYSSLSHLARMPVNEVKIDRSFVIGLEVDPEFTTVVRSAIEMGHNLGLKVVAEGIETEGSAERLRAMHCDIAQGYLYAEPMPAGALQKWLEDKTRVPLAVPAALADEIAETAPAAAAAIL
jgi:diguanylate cyclase (GGDEF)-like protein